MPPKNSDYRAERCTADWSNMVFKNFRYQVILRIAAMLAASSLLAWCLVTQHYLRVVYAGVAVAVIVVDFFRYVDRFNRDVKSFMISLLQKDFTTRYQASGRSRTFDQLYEVLNRISEAFRNLSKEKEVQFRYLEMLVEHLRVGILSLDDKGKIQLANEALKDLLQKKVLFSLKSFPPQLADTLRDIRGNETRLVKLLVKNELMQLSIHASEFRLEEKYYKLISMQNIRSELDAREMEAWQKLIRVLTHEIMNSVSPVMSLSDSLHGLVIQREQGAGAENKNLFATLEKGLEAIRIRSQGLHHFTQSYRKLTGIPEVSLKETTTKTIFDQVMTLMRSRMEEKGIVFTVSTTNIPVVVDPGLMEHVLINLLLNAMEAVCETTNPRIEMSAGTNAKGGVCLYVSDNGHGIDEATADKIFIPFFTTRKDGSGIGLALAKQILQLHHADIHFTSEIDKGTEFVIVL
jgi:nitrogen fixation/metabolism regulation signal transduction histidine kinase